MVKKKSVIELEKMKISGVLWHVFLRRIRYRRKAFIVSQLKPQSQLHSQLCRKMAFALLAIRNCRYLNKIGSEIRNPSELWLFAMVEMSSDGGSMWILFQLLFFPRFHLYFFGYFSEPICTLNARLRC